jgi:hypothetical protein
MAFSGETITPKISATAVTIQTAELTIVQYAFLIKIKSKRLP